MFFSGQFYKLKAIFKSIELDHCITEKDQVLKGSLKIDSNIVMEAKEEMDIK